MSVFWRIRSDCIIRKKRFFLQMIFAVVANYACCEQNSLKLPVVLWSQYDAEQWIMGSYCSGVTDMLTILIFYKWIFYIIIYLSLINSALIEGLRRRFIKSINISLISAIKPLQLYVCVRTGSLRCLKDLTTLLFRTVLTKRSYLMISSPTCNCLYVRLNTIRFLIRCIVVSISHWFLLFVLTFSCVTQNVVYVNMM